MKPARRILLAVIGSCSVVLALDALGNRAVVHALYWCRPAFDKIFPPWDAGPNPIATLGALLVDIVILTIAMLALLPRKRRAHG